MSEVPAKKKCPGCKEGWMEVGVGVLDQSGGTHLVTRTWECKDCGAKEWERTYSHWVVDD